MIMFARRWVGVMDEQQKQKAVNWLSSMAPAGIRCETCGNTQWDLAKDLVMPITFHGGDIVIGGGPSYPQVMLICRRCGNTKFFNAVKMGVVGKETVSTSSRGGGVDG